MKRVHSLAGALAAALVAGVLVAAPLFGGDEEGAATRAARPGDDVRALEQHLFLIGALDRLDLTRAQLAGILAAAEEAEDARRDHEAAMRELLAEEEVAFRAFYEEDLRNTGFSRAVERRTGRLNRRGKAMRKAYFERIGPIEERVIELLTPAQHAALEDLRIGWRRKPGGRGSGKKPAPDPRREREAEIRGELKKIHRAEYGSLGPIGRLLVRPGAVEAIEGRLGRGGGGARSILASSPGPAPAVDGNAARVAELRADINLLNLINGLNLAPAQIDRILEANAGAVVLEAGARTGPSPRSPAAFRTKAGATYRRGLTAAVDRACAGAGIGKEELRRLRKMRNRAIAAERRGPAPKILRKRHAERLDEAAGAVLASLTEGQRQVLFTYKPCLIPPRHLKDPVRAGQASDNSGIERMLRGVRRIPGRKWTRTRGRVLERIVSRTDRARGELDGSAREALKARVAPILERARSMTDLDFQLELEALAEELEFLNRKKVLQEELREVIGEDEVVLAKVRRFLVNPRIVPLLEARRVQLTQAKAAESVDLDGIEPAESCDKDSCAIDGKARRTLH